MHFGVFFISSSEEFVPPQSFAEGCVWPLSGGPCSKLMDQSSFQESGVAQFETNLKITA